MNVGTIGTRKRYLIHLGRACYLSAIPSECIDLATLEAMDDSDIEFTDSVRIPLTHVDADMVLLHAERIQRNFRQSSQIPCLGYCERSKDVAGRGGGGGGRL